MPYVSGYAECLSCGKMWYAVWPLAAKPLECPRCGSFDSYREIIERDDKGRAVKFTPDYKD